MIHVILDRLGHKKGLTVKGTQIVDWPYPQPIPTIEELRQWETEYRAKVDYLEKRKAEYPSREEVLDAVFDKLAYQDSTKLEAIKLRREAIDSKYPKPE